MHDFHKYEAAWRCVFHLRNDGYPTENADLPKKIKVLTIVVLFDKSGLVASGGAACNRKDHWSRKIGVAIAEGRAKKVMTKALAGNWEQALIEPWEMSIWQPQLPERFAEAKRVVEVIHGYLMGKMVLSKGKQ